MQTLAAASSELQPTGGGRGFSPLPCRDAAAGSPSRPCLSPIPQASPRPFAATWRPAEKPEHIFKYSAASSELAACDAQGGPPSSSPLAGATATVAIIVEDKQAAATGRLEQLSNPVLRVASHGALRNGLAVGSAAGSEDGEQGLPWWRQQQDGQLHAAPAAEGLPSHPQLPALGLGLGSSGGSPLGRSPPREFEQMQAVCSPTQQLLSRESSDCLGPLRGGGGSSIFERTLAEAGSGGMLRRESVLLDGLSSSGKGGLQRR